MALTNFTELIAALQDKADTSHDFLDELRLAEIQAQLDLRIRLTETEVTGTVTAAQDYITLPSDCVFPRHLRLDTSPIGNVDIVAPQVFDWYRQNFAGSKPLVAMSSGLTLKIAPTPGTNYPYTLFYDRGIPALTSSNQTNFLLTNYPNVLLYGALLQYGLGREGGDQRSAGWGQLYSAAAGPAKSREAAARLGGGPIAMRPETWA